MLKAKEEKRLLDGMLIVEATSGNMGISLAAIGTYYKHPVHIFLPDWVSNEKVMLLEMYGANVTMVSKEEGGFIECIKRAKELAEKEGGFFTDQFNNEFNVEAHYNTTGLEILKQVKKPLAFVSGIGTGGTLMGVGKRLKEEDKSIQLVALEPENLPLISSKRIIATHLIEGIGDDFIPGIVDENAIDNVILISDCDAINMSRNIAKELGLGVGISSGANLIGAILTNEQMIKLGFVGAVVTVFADDNKKYLSTKLSSKTFNKDNIFVSSNTKLLTYEYVNS